MWRRLASCCLSPPQPCAQSPAKACPTLQWPFIRPAGCAASKCTPSPPTPPHRLVWLPQGLPRWASVRPFLEVASTLFVRTLFGMTSYTSMTAAATRLGTLCTAAHQVAMQVRQG